MTTPEALKLLTAKTPSLVRVDPGPKGGFSWEDVAGAMGRCSKMAREYARLRYEILPEPGHPRLEAFIGAFRMSVVLPIFEENDWRSGPLSAMARLVVEDAIFPWTCKGCRGVGERVMGGRVITCDYCSGTGVKRLTDARRAELMDIPLRTYQRHWVARYKRVYSEIEAYETEVQEALSKG